MKFTKEQLSENPDLGNHEVTWNPFDSIWVCVKWCKECIKEVPDVR